MTKGKDPQSNQRKIRETEIFRHPPGSGNYSSSIGAAQGIELFSGAGQVRRAGRTKRSWSLRDNSGICRNYAPPIGVGHWPQPKLARGPWNVDTS